MKGRKRSWIRGYCTISLGFHCTLLRRTSGTPCNRADLPYLGEIFLAVSQHTQGWIGHMGGFQALIELRGPQSFRTPFARAMLHNVRQVHVMESFLKRKASYLAAPEWVASAEETKSLASDAVSMAHLVGVAIEKSDKMCLLGRDKVKEAEIMNLLSEMLELEDDLNE